MPRVFGTYACSVASQGFQREDIDEDPATFHAREFAHGDRALWTPHLDARRTLVLGSSQPDDELDRPNLEAEGIDVARRRTGGGAVLVGSDELIWFDVVLQATDPLWVADVGRSFDWIGRSVQRALREFGVDTEMYEGPLHRTEWSGRVCFAGLGPGELVRDGRKLVGMSQRRTRTAARFQVAILRRWDGPLHRRLFQVPAADRSTADEVLSNAATAIDHSPVDVLAAVESELRGISSSATTRGTR